MSLLLTTNFSTAQCEQSLTAVRLGIDNHLPYPLLPNARLAAEGLELVCVELGHLVVIHSWYRCEELERVLTAKDFARWCLQRNRPSFSESAWADYYATKGHPKAYSIDFTCPQFGPPSDIVKMIAESRIKFDQLILEGTWVHLSFDPRLRMEVLSATFDNGVPKYDRLAETA